MIRRPLRAAAFLLALLSLAATPVAALETGPRRWWIEDFRVNVFVHRDGTVRVEERISPHFVGAWNGLFRTIPIRTTYHGLDRTLRLKLNKITDDNQRPLKYEVSREGDYRKFKIWIPGARDAIRTVILDYEVENEVRYFDEHDEFYWNVTGNEWPVSIQGAAVDVFVPQEAASHLRAVAYTGPYGSAASDADLSLDGANVHVSTRHALGIREGLTIAVAWDKGVVAAPSFSKKLRWFLADNWIFFVPIGVFVGMFWLWNTRGRDPRLGRSVMPIYEPPDKLTPAEMGTLVDDTVDMRDITATLVDLAVRGFIHIKETEDKGVIFTSHDYRFTLKKGGDKWEGLKPHERALLEGMFTGRSAGTTCTLSSLENEFYKELPGIREALYDRLVEQGHYASRPDKVKHFYMGLGAVVLALGIFGGVAVAQGLDISPLAMILSAVASGLIIVAFGYFMPAKTTRGAKALVDVLGFEEFLGRAEKDKMERMVQSTEMFEKYLPYAMALGVETIWARAFADLYKQPPQWYEGNYARGFNSNIFLNDLSRMTSRAGTTFVSAPRSSGGGSWGGSGFGGGGFSGGGGGGGGGGAF